MGLEQMCVRCANRKPIGGATLSGLRTGVKDMVSDTAGKEKVFIKVTPLPVDNQGLS